MSLPVCEAQRSPKPSDRRPPWSQPVIGVTSSEGVETTVNVETPSRASSSNRHLDGVPTSAVEATHVALEISGRRSGGGNGGVGGGEGGGRGGSGNGEGGGGLRRRGGGGGGGGGRESRWRLRRGDVIRGAGGGSTLDANDSRRAADATGSRAWASSESVAACGLASGRLTGGGLAGGTSVIGGLASAAADAAWLWSCSSGVAPAARTRASAAAQQPAQHCKSRRQATILVIQPLIQQPSCDVTTFLSSCRANVHSIL